MKTLYPQNLNSVLRGLDQPVCYGRLTTAPESAISAHSHQPVSYLAASQPADGGQSGGNSMDFAANYLGHLMAEALTASISAYKTGSDLAMRA